MAESQITWCLYVNIHIYIYIFNNWNDPLPPGVFSFSSIVDPLQKEGVSFPFRNLFSSPNVLCFGPFRTLAWPNFDPFDLKLRGFGTTVLMIMGLNGVAKFSEMDNNDVQYRIFDMAWFIWYMMTEKWNRSYLIDDYIWYMMYRRYIIYDISNKW